MTRLSTIILVKTWFKLVEWCRRYSTFFPSVFKGDTFSTWKMENKLCGNLESCSTHLIELEYLDHNQQTILEFVEPFSRKLTICVFPSTWKRWKMKQNFEKKYKKCIVPHSPDWRFIWILWLSITVCTILWPNH